MSARVAWAAPSVSNAARRLNLFIMGGLSFAFGWGWMPRYRSNSEMFRACNTQVNARRSLCTHGEVGPAGGHWAFSPPRGVPIAASSAWRSWRPRYRAVPDDSQNPRWQHSWQPPTKLILSGRWAELPQREGWILCPSHRAARPCCPSRRVSGDPHWWWSMSLEIFSGGPDPLLDADSRSRT
jgi:hypothetical protein